MYLDSKLPPTSELKNVMVWLVKVGCNDHSFEWVIKGAVTQILHYCGDDDLADKILEMVGEKVDWNHRTDEENREIVKKVISLLENMCNVG